MVGFITQEEYDNPTVKNWIKASENQKIGEIQWFEEDILIKRKVLEKVGSFNPWLKLREEGELSYRILNAGFKLYRLPFKMSHHLGGENENFGTRTRRTILSAIVLGQILRYSLKDVKILVRHIRDSKFIIAIVFVFLLILLSIVLFYIRDDFRLFYLALIFLLAVYTRTFIEKRNIPRALSHIVSITFRWPFLLLGFLKYPKKPSRYPNNTSIIKI